MKMNRKNIIFPLTIVFSMAIMFGTNDAENHAPGGHPDSQSGGKQSSCTGHTYIMDFSYEPLDPYSHTFFTTQFATDLIEEFSKCCFEINLIPCSFAHIEDGHLTCVNGEKECVLDRMFACATKLNEDNIKSVGKFVVNMFKAGNQIDSAKQIACSNGLKNWDAIEKCYKGRDGDKHCQEYWNYRDSNVVPYPSYNITIFAQFKAYLCEEVKSVNLSCPFCSKGASGSGNGGNGSTGGAHGGGSANGGGHTNGGAQGH